MSAGACAVHPAQPAFVTCSACNTPACEYCLAGGDVCAACRDRDESVGIIAWERRDLGIATRFTRTIRQVLGRGAHTFAELRPGSVAASLVYVALVYALTSLFALVVLAPCLVLSLLGWQTPLQHAETAVAIPVMILALCGGPFVQAIVGVLAALALGLVYHAGVKLAGGTGGLDTSLRVAAYGLTVVLVWAPLTVALLLPTLGAVVMGVVLLAQLVWGAHIGTTVARSHHGLDGTRAVLAGAFPAAITVLALALVASAAWIVSDVTQPSQAPDIYYPDPGY